MECPGQSLASALRIHSTADVESLANHRHRPLSRWSAHQSCAIGCIPLQSAILPTDFAGVFPEEKYHLLRVCTQIGTCVAKEPYNRAPLLEPIATPSPSLCTRNGFRGQTSACRASFSCHFRTLATARPRVGSQVPLQDSFLIPLSHVSAGCITGHRPLNPRQHPLLRHAYLQHYRCVPAMVFVGELALDAQSSVDDVSPLFSYTGGWVDSNKGDPMYTSYSNSTFHATLSKVHTLRQIHETSFIIFVRTSQRR